MRPRLWVLAALFLVTTACSPALDWRLTSIPETKLTAFFPCKPDHFSRQISLMGAPQRVVLASCKAAQHTFAVSAMDIRQSGSAAQGLAALKHSAEQNFGGFSQTLPQRLIAGAADAGRAEVVAAQLQAAEHRSLHAQMVFFSHGHWVFQATVMGEALASDAVVFFFDNLTLKP
jgi:hypothetical protein